MGAYKIISIADKLKNLRQKYNLKQEEVSRDAVTRNLISQIENNKANLTKNVAENVIYNLNKLRGGKNVKIDETVEYLMEDEKSQANKILDKYINDLKELSIYKDGTFQNKLNEVEEFLVDWDIRDKKINIFELAGDYYCNINDFYNSTIYYEKAKALIQTYDENSISILRKLSTVYYYMGKYDEDIKCCDFALNHFINMNDKYYCIFTFNSALCYFKLKEYTKTLYKCTKIEEITKEINIQKYYELIGQEAICLAKLNKYEESLKIFIELSENIDKNDTQSYTIALLNLADNYLDLNNIDKAKEALSIIQKNINNLNQNNPKLPEIYFGLGEVYEKLKNMTKADELYTKALTYAKKFNRNTSTKYILSKLMDIYRISKDKKKVSEIKNEYFILSAKEGKIIEPLERKLIEFYLDTEDIKPLRDLYNFNKKLS